ncbi:2Fe-2S iron-sulfur cluster binding domain-containing protein [Carbonactinospora thermoautotrophica]|uniref:2Fe-2S iron-sulfur cluster binding domain-containing protein n=1 Tax=Carbonactinospora thermoautotrophica TaxID=1469144 RepID=UPI0018D32F55|nr:2Fe-2S iron-sulfur cluster binding domain-containing protein [Carbonactinospora thermoautotrophica]
MTSTMRSSPVPVSSATTARTYRVAVATTGESFEVREGEPILAAARRAGIWLPFECGWGSCGTCKVTLLDGEVDLLFPDAPAVQTRDARRRRTITCQATARSDLTIKPSWASDRPREELPTADHRAELVEVEELGPGIRRFGFRLDAPATYRPGQYAILQLGPGLRRCYSMANLPGSTLVEFIAKRYPGRPGSEGLFASTPGQRLALELPYGDMWLRPGTRPVVLIAGGTGISPILALARQLAATGDARAVHLFYGANTRAELVCWEELTALAAAMPDATLHGALLRPGPGWTHTTGFVTEALEPHLGRLVDSDFYLAGPPPMADAVLALLRAHGVQLDRIHFDRFG